MEADIVFTSTAATDFLVGPDMVTRAMKARRYRPLFLIDTAVPRNVDPRVNRLSNVYLYDTDDLQQVVESHLGERLEEARDAERIVEAELARFEAWLDGQQAVPTVVALRRRLHAIQEQETARVLRRLREASDKDRALVEGLGRAIVNKILHRPTVTLKRSPEEDLDRAARSLFGLTEEGEDDEEGAESSQA